MSGRDNDEHGGYPLDEPRWIRDGSADGLLNPSLDTNAQDSPVDLAAVQADDALLSLLGRGTDPLPGGPDAELARVLVAWRREVDSEPFSDLVDPDTVTTVLAAARKPAPRRHPVLGPFAAAAAVLVIAFSGVGLVAKSAHPGDQLWSLTKVLYTDYARSVEAAERVKAELVEADKAIRQGNTSQAKESLDRVEQELSEVNEDQNRTELAAQYQQLEEKLQRGDVDGEAPVTDPKPAPPSSSAAPVLPVPSESASATPSAPPTTESSVPPSSSEPPTPTSSVPNEPGPRSSDPTPQATTLEDGASTTSSSQSVS